MISRDKVREMETLGLLGGWAPTKGTNWDNWTVHGAPRGFYGGRTVSTNQ